MEMNTRVRGAGTLIRTENQKLSEFWRYVKKNHSLYVLVQRSMGKQLGRAALVRAVFCDASIAESHLEYIGHYHLSITCMDLR